MPLVVTAPLGSAGSLVELSAPHGNNPLHGLLEPLTAGLSLLVTSQFGPGSDAPYAFDARTTLALIFMRGGNGGGGGAVSGAGTAAAAGGGGEGASLILALKGAKLLPGSAFVVGTNGAGGTAGPSPGGNGGATTWSDSDGNDNIAGAGTGGQTGLGVTLGLRAGGFGGANDVEGKSLNPNDIEVLLDVPGVAGGNGRVFSSTVAEGGSSRWSPGRIAGNGNNGPGTGGRCAGASSAAGGSGNSTLEADNPFLVVLEFG